MIVRLVAATVVAAAVLLSVWAAYRTLGRPMPRSAWPLLITASLVGYAAYDEYSWRSRTLAALPDQVVVAGEGASRSALSPWSYLVPRTDRLSLIDRRRVRTHPDHPGLRLVEIALLERMQPTRKVEEVVDCAGDRAAVLRGEPEFGADGLPEGARWYPLDADDARLDIVCDRA